MRKSLAIFAVIASLAFMAVSTVACSNESSGGGSGGSASFTSKTQDVDLGALSGGLVSTVNSVTVDDTSILTVTKKSGAVVTGTSKAPGSTVVKFDTDVGEVKVKVTVNKKGDLADFSVI